ncbi:hypothetical protein HF1_08850 [Mycoplasma haemofelis str. Langford 1]|uniref:Uncharacterized protein n=1 Tax=Mycoplasma haemofelis (strain Langford 1) TaxID=941640 RepID=E8ZIC2_MYCHL|nr:hypothetical protein [Mycoplasma haemofelis]CBY92893.1 hypothetical protein HF1_08850 [Mycoplasma haemofelis str. Langford 1]
MNSLLEIIKHEGSRPRLRHFLDQIKQMKKLLIRVRYGSYPSSPFQEEPCGYKHLLKEARHKYQSLWNLYEEVMRIMIEGKVCKSNPTSFIKLDQAICEEMKQIHQSLYTPEES